MDNKLSQEQVWNKIAEPWKEYRQSKIPTVVYFLKNKTGKIIDLGCGGGRNLISGKDREYYAIDFSQQQIKNAKKYAKENKIKSRFYKSKASKLDKKIFKHNMFDYGLYVATLHCLETEKERKDSLKEFYRVLKKGARALITVWDIKDKKFRNIGDKKEIYLKWNVKGKNYWRYYYLYEEKELKNLLKEIGFKIIKRHSPIEGDRFSEKNLIFEIEKPFLLKKRQAPR